LWIGTRFGKAGRNGLSSITILTKFHVRIQMKKTSKRDSDDVYAIVDCETTNPSPTYGRIIEVAALRVEKGRIVETFHSLINPDRPIQPTIQAITGISQIELEHAPQFHEIAGALWSLLRGAIVVAHNARYDYAFLKHEFLRSHRRFSATCLDTVALSKALFPDFRHHDLSSLIVRHNLTCPRRHRALDDATALFQFMQTAEREVGTERFRSASASLLGARRPANVLRPDLDALPEGPGVYLLYGSRDELLYVGKSKHVRKRVMSHFSRADTDSKELQLFQETHRVEGRGTSGELGALLLESQLIKKLRPMHNRAGRAKRRLTVVIRKLTKQGYAAAVMEQRETIEPGELGTILTVYKSREQAREGMTELAKEFSLCYTLLDLERSANGCFQYQLHRCHGACVGEEDPGAYNARFDAAFRNRSMKAWPYRRGILIREYSEEGTSGEAFLVDQWCLLGSLRSSGEGFQDIQPGLNGFDFDTYKILVRFLAVPKNRRSVVVLSRQDEDAILSGMMSPFPPQTIAESPLP
jgi:DNA polymerase-3 subunit epsilon